LKDKRLNNTAINPNTFLEILEQVELKIQLTNNACLSVYNMPVYYKVNAYKIKNITTGLKFKPKVHYRD